MMYDNTGFFVMNDSNQLPFATIKVYGYSGFQYMSGQLGSQW